MPIVDGAKIRALRERRVLSQMDLAKQAGVSDRTIRDIERGKYVDARPSTIRKLAAALAVEPSELLSND